VNRAVIDIDPHKPLLEVGRTGKLLLQLSAVEDTLALGLIKNGSGSVCTGQQEVLLAGSRIVLFAAIYISRETMGTENGRNVERERESSG
jgi:hypothetical protein